MILVYNSNGKEVKVGDCVGVHINQIRYVKSMFPPQYEGSPGVVWLTATPMLKDNETENPTAQGYFPSMIGASWVETEEDV